MVVSSSTFMSDTFYFIKTSLLTAITDPLAGSRIGNEGFIMTAYPKRPVNYPIITLRIIDTPTIRAGMQTTAVDTTLRMEARIWARNTKERDVLFQQLLNGLKNIQYTAGTGSQVNGLHNFTVLSSIEINEDGDNTPKSRLAVIQYTYYNPS